MPQIPHTVTVPFWVAVLIAVAIVVLVIILWSVKRKQRPNLESTSGTGSTLKSTLSALLQTTLLKGNKVELIHNGMYFDRLFADIEAAKATINIETFLSKHGKMTEKLTDLLVKKREVGVEVRLLLDGSGGRGYGKKDLQRLKRAGCIVSHYRPFGIRNLGRMNQRTHRKIAIIDGRIGYIGGHCFVDTWCGTAQDKQHFRDITARVEGPVVLQLQSTFTDNWIEETAEVIAGEKHFPDLEPCGDTLGMIVFALPVGGPSTLKLLHYMAIKEAQKSLTIQNPYFLPDPDAREALLEAVKRGVEVRIMIPETQATDAKLVSHASHHHYGTLLKGGVRIFDYQRTLLHQKVFTVDGEWTSIGSTNFDDRSFEINDEVSLVSFDPEIARQLEESFEKDSKFARERSLEEWKKRPIFHKLKDFFCFLLNEQL